LGGGRTKTSEGELSKRRKGFNQGEKGDVNPSFAGDPPRKKGYASIYWGRMQNQLKEETTT